MRDDTSLTADVGLLNGTRDGVGEGSNVLHDEEGTAGVDEEVTAGFDEEGIAGINGGEEGYGAAGVA